MKRSKKFLVISIIIAILIFFGIALFVLLKNAKNIEQEKEDEFVWQAKYIWFQEDEGLSYLDKRNKWACFRKTINIDSKRDIKNVTAKIAADSKYWLYINGEIVVKEGGLKRGEKPESTYYDEVILDDYLQKGENTIAVLVWYFGKTSYSHISIKDASFLFQVQIGEQTIISDNSWKTIQNPAFLKDIPIINPRLSEENIYYDAREELANWYKIDFDDSSWENAKELGNAGELPWGELIKRNIPFFEYSEIREYENFSSLKNKTVDKNTLLALELPYNMQIVPYLKVEAKEGQKIYITLDEEYDSVGKEHKTTYITKNGIQEFESPAWINGEKIFYLIPKDVKIISLGYRETGYKIEKAGSFSTNDEFYNKLWNKAYTTLYLNMRDSYMDCPDRERAEWWGDASIDMEEAVYSLDPNANYLYQKAVNTLIGWRYDGILMTISPSNELNNMHLPIQMLLGIVSMYDYYLYTGELDFLEQIYPVVKEYLYKWNIEPDGLASYTEGYALWRWEDSSGYCDYVAAENAWYYYALSKFYDMAIVLDKQEDLLDIESRLNCIYVSFNDNLWRGDGYREWGNESYDTRVNAVAVLSGLANEDMYEDITTILMGNTENSPFMEKYILEALCKMGKIEEAQERMKSQYSGMVNSNLSTVWEYFDESTGSKNHAWAGGPIVIMSKYFAGITPSFPGFDEINVKPQFGSLTNINAKVNTVSGAVEINAEKTSERIKIELDTPTKTRIALEKVVDNPSIYINGKCVYKEGEEKFSLKGQYETEDDEYIYYLVEKGRYVLESK